MKLFAHVPRIRLLGLGLAALVASAIAQVGPARADYPVTDRNSDEVVICAKAVSTTSAPCSSTYVHDGSTWRPWLSDSSGRGYVNVNGTVGVTSTDVTATTGSKAAGTAAASSKLIGGVYNTSLPTLSNGQQAAAQFDSSGRLIVNCGSGCSGGGGSGTQYAEDAAHVSGDTGTMLLGVRASSPANTSSANGDYEPLQVNGGRLWASATIDAALPAGTNNIGDVDVLSLPALPAGTNNIGDVDVASLPALAAGENHIGSVGGHTVIRGLAMSTDTSAYAAGDVIADSQQIDAAFRATNLSGKVESVVLIDKDDQKAALEVCFLDANVSMGTENAQPSISDANAEASLGCIDVATADYRDRGGVSVAAFSNLRLPVRAASGTDDLYVAIINGSGTPTYTATGLYLRVGITQD